MMSELPAATRSLRMAYGRKDALSGVDIGLMEGSITALCGANASGKTTLLKVLSGLIQPWRGEVRVLGQQDTWLAKKDVCYHSAHPWFDPRHTVSQAARSTQRLRTRFDRDLLEQMLQEFGLSPTERLSELSRGRCALALLLISLCTDAHLYLLDEPFSGLDIRVRAQIRQAILRRADPERTFLIATHELTDMEAMFDRLILLKEGRVKLQGDADDLRGQYRSSLADLVRREL